MRRPGTRALGCAATWWLTGLAGCGGQPIPPERQPWEWSQYAVSDPDGDGDGATAGDSHAGRGAAHRARGRSGGSDNPLDARYGSAGAVETLRGRASYYADSLAGHHTANGDVYDPRAYTAASRELPFGTVLRVVREETGASVLVRVNDRGPFGDHSRILDLSRAAAEALDMIRAGVVRIRAEIVHRP